MSWKVLVTPRAFWVSGQRGMAELESVGCELVQSPIFAPFTDDKVCEFAAGCDATVAGGEQYSRRVFEACPDLKVVSRCGVGTDAVDLEAATDTGVIVTNTPGAMTQAVADYAWALLLGVARGIAEGDRMMRAGGWGEIVGTLVHRKTLGLIGVGRIGSAVARRAAGFEMKVIAHDPAGAPAGLDIEMTTLEDVLRRSDYVSLHAASTPETRHLINAERLALMKPTAYLINTSRGALVDEPALVAALHAGAIKGAALDVYEAEPAPADAPIRSAPNCVLAPHNAFNAIEAAEEMTWGSAYNVAALLTGRKPQNICNPAVLASDRLRFPEAKDVLCA